MDGVALTFDDGPHELCTPELLDRLERHRARATFFVIAPLAIAEQHGLRLVHWTVDTHDWRGDRADAMFAATRPRLRPGPVVRANDGGGPGARRADTAQTIAYVDLVARYPALRRLRLEALE